MPARRQTAKKATVANAPVPFVPQQTVQPIHDEEREELLSPETIAKLRASKLFDETVEQAAAHWTEANHPLGWDKLRDEARQIAIDEANRVYEGGAEEADAITAGVIAAKLWATARGVNVRK